MNPYLGEIRMFCGGFAPNGWALCNGQILPIAQNTALFSILGTTYGGDGKTNFSLPNLAGATPIQSNNANYPLGAKGGSATKSLTAAQLPAHTHAVTAKIKAKAGGADQNTPVGNYPANTAAKDRQYATAPNSAMAADVISATVAPAGGGASVNNMQPYQAVNFIIALTGVYPQRP